MVSLVEEIPFYADDARKIYGVGLGHIDESIRNRAYWGFNDYGWSSDLPDAEAEMLRVSEVYRTRGFTVVASNDGEYCRINIGW